MKTIRTATSLPTATYVIHNGNWTVIKSTRMIALPNAVTYHHWYWKTHPRISGWTSVSLVITVGQHLIVGRKPITTVMRQWDSQVPPHVLCSDWHHTNGTHGTDGRLPRQVPWFCDSKYATTLYLLAETDRVHLSTPENSWLKIKWTTLYLHLFKRTWQYCGVESMAGKLHQHVRHGGWQLRTHVMRWNRGYSRRTYLRRRRGHSLTQIIGFDKNQAGMWITYPLVLIRVIQGKASY